MFVLGNYLSKYMINKIVLLTTLMVLWLARSHQGRGFEQKSCKTEDNEIGICCFSAKHTNSKDWLARNQNNVSQ